MRGSSYRERDYAFGHVILTLRTKLGLTQSAVADMLGVSRRAVSDWEGGLTYGWRGVRTGRCWPAPVMMASCVWNASNGRLHRHLPGHHGKVNDVAWSRDGKWLASGAGRSDSGELFVWDVHSGERVRVLSEHPGIVYAVAWDSTGTMLISGGSV